MQIPAPYAWLANVEGRPHVIDQALALLGTAEAPGAVNAPVILSWAKEIGGLVADVYKADSIPWCGLFAAVVSERAGWEPPNNPLWALSWSAFGAPAEKPSLGDVLIFVRDGGGHVGFYVAEDTTAFHVLGGNQGDRVCIARVAKTRLYAARRPIWRVAPPAGRRPFTVASSGTLSTNEA